jgi:transglutaminase-like putative cysteine protease
MRLDAGCEIVFDVTAPTPIILMLRPRSGNGQWIFAESYDFSQQVEISEYVDNNGNLCQRLIAPVGRFVITANAKAVAAEIIDVEPGAPLTLVQDLPDYALQFLLPSRYCQADFLGDLALQIVGEAKPGYDQVEALRLWIHKNIQYQYGTSNASTSAIDTVETKQGVCRDFAHLGIALCRSLEIPARMVVGYLYELEPMDLHAWFEAYVGGRWYTFDATQDTPRGGRITVASGRDAVDVAFATVYGQADLLEMKVRVESEKFE